VDSRRLWGEHCPKKGERNRARLEENIKKKKVGDGSGTENRTKKNCPCSVNPHIVGGRKEKSHDQYVRETEKKTTKFRVYSPAPGKVERAVGAGTEGSKGEKKRKVGLLGTGKGKKPWTEGKGVVKYRGCEGGRENRMEYAPATTSRISIGEKKDQTKGNNPITCRRHKTGERTLEAMPSGTKKKGERDGVRPITKPGQAGEEEGRLLGHGGLTGTTPHTTEKKESGRRHEMKKTASSTLKTRAP